MNYFNEGGMRWEQSIISVLVLIFWISCKHSIFFVQNEEKLLIRAVLTQRELDPRAFPQSDKVFVVLYSIP